MKIFEDFVKTIPIGIVAILSYAVPRFIEFIVARHMDKSRERRVAYTKFAETFTPYLQELEMGESTLNLLIISEFPKHDLAIRDFLHHVKRFRKRGFIKKWAEYRAKYDQINNMGKLGGFPIGIVAAIAPNEEALNRARTSPNEPLQWEFDRKKELHRIIHELLKIAEP